MISVEGEVSGGGEGVRYEGGRVKVGVRVRGEGED